MPAAIRAMVSPLITTTRVWKLHRAPLAALGDDTFELTTEELPPIKQNEILVQTTYLSNDPSQRAYIQKDADAERLYAPPVREGNIMAAYGLAKVLASRSEKWRVGDLVLASTGWREHAVLPADRVKPVIQIPGHSPTLALGYLGMPGLTAWHGLHDVCNAKPEHTILVSGAAGSTGSAAIQIAKKIIGAKRVIGIAGGPTKCAWVEKIGADICLDYRAPDFHQQLIEATDGFVDIYLDHVGGDLLNKVLVRMKRWGRIAAVGSISAYNDASKSHLPNWTEVISNRLTITGFIVTDFASQWPAALAKLAQAVKDGTLTVDGCETIRTVGFEKVPEVWKGLFAGVNQGKLVTKLFP